MENRLLPNADPDRPAEENGHEQVALIPIAPGQVELFDPTALDPGLLSPPEQSAIWPELLPPPPVLLLDAPAAPRPRSRWTGVARLALSAVLLVVSGAFIYGTRELSVSEVASVAGPSIVTITLADGVGSGVIVDGAGWIVTNEHVVGSAKQVIVEMSNGEQFQGEVYGTDTLTDLAIVRIQPDRTLPALPFGDSDTLRPGQDVVVIGTALGTYANSVSAGIVSGLGRSTQVEGGIILRSLIQTDAAINRGNSGGALLDRRGRLVGINSAIARLDVAQGIGFAIPVAAVRPLVDQARAGVPLARPWLGIRFLDLAPVDALALGISGGALLDGDADAPAVVPDSPADQAGLRQDDVIIAIAGRPIDLAHALDDLVSRHRPGETIEITVLRAGEQLTVTLTLGTRPRG